jgi:hypothetical protein
MMVVHREGGFKNASFGISPSATPIADCRIVRSLVTPDILHSTHIPAH